VQSTKYEHTVHLPRELLYADYTPMEVLSSGHVRREDAFPDTGIDAIEAAAELARRKHPA